MQSLQKMQQAALLLFEGEQLDFVNMICKENHDLAMLTGELRKAVDSLTHRLDQLAPVVKRRDIFGAESHTRYFLQICLEAQRWEAAGVSKDWPKPLSNLVKGLSDRTGVASFILAATFKSTRHFHWLKVGLHIDHSF